MNLNNPVISCCNVISNVDAKSAKEVFMILAFIHQNKYIEIKFLFIYFICAITGLLIVILTLEMLYGSDKINGKIY